MQDVVLDEDGGRRGPARPGRPRRPGRAAERPDDPAARARRGRLRRLRALAAVLVVASGLAVADGALRRPPTDPLEVTGALAPVAGPVRELWRAPDVVAEGLTAVSGLLVGTAEHADADVDLVGLDPATGATAWRTPLLAGTRRHGGARCVTPAADGAGARRTVCVTADAVGPIDDFSPLSVVEPTRARRLVVDPVTGEVLREEPVDPTTSLAALGADLVVSTVGPSGLLRVARTDVEGTAERWSFTSPEPLRSDRDGRSARVVVRDDLVVAGGDTGWALTGDGTPLVAWGVSGRGTGRAELVGDRYLAQQVPPPGLRHVVQDLRTGISFVADARPVGAAVDDGSAPGVVLAQAAGDTLAAYSAPSARRLWAVPEGGSGPLGLVVLRGRVVRLEDDAVSAVDARTGRTLWSTTATPVTRAGLATDGQVVLCVVRDTDRGAVLRALDVDDGRLRWEADLPDDVERLAVRDGRLLGAAPDALVALG